jgi:hypothetical protein
MLAISDRMTKAEKLKHLDNAVHWLDRAVNDTAWENPSAFEQYLYNAIRRIGAVVEELVKEQSDE